MLKVQIENVQHIKELIFETDMAQHDLTCLVGRNGTGKTTLVRAIKNLISSDTFQNTASPYIFSANSKITYQLDDSEYEFTFRPELGVIDSRDSISRTLRASIEVELPIPDGIRFNHFRQLIRIDEDLRTAISLREYQTPDELITFLTTVYGHNRFSNLKEFTLGRSKYYFVLKEDDFYIREDYLSSGEYFLIHLFKLLESGKRLIVIDEIDISLDAAAQANLIDLLRSICQERGLKMVFTTHSLALMETLQAGELSYMSEDEGVVSIEVASYNYVKSMLFGFVGWDKYVLTEDAVLESFLQYLIRKHADGVPLCQYKIIAVGTASSVVNLMLSNDTSQFLGPADSVICVVDGDQRNFGFVRDNDRVWCIPYNNIEAHFYNLALNRDPRLPPVEGYTDKAFFEHVVRRGLLSEQSVFDIVCESNVEQVRELAVRLVESISIQGH